MPKPWVAGLIRAAEGGAIGAAADFVLAGGDLDPKRVGAVATAGALIAVRNWLLPAPPKKPKKPK